jgi:hypothetical protein
MTPFVIFVIILTVAYVIYYAAVIYGDVRGKKVEDNKGIESFDLASMQSEETSVEVRESGTGFVVGKPNVEPEVHNPTQPTAEEDAKPSPLDEKLNRVNEQMYAANATSTGATDKDIFRELLMYGDVNDHNVGIVMERTNY